MKRIALFTFLLSTMIYSQPIDSIQVYFQLVREHAQAIVDLTGGVSNSRYDNAQIDAMFAQSASERTTDDARLQASIDSLKIRVKALEDGAPIIITPKPVTNFEVHATNTTTIAGSFIEPVDTGTYYIRYRVYSAMGDQLPYVNIDTVQHGNTTFSVTGLTPSTTYQFDEYTVVSEVVSPSDFATSDTATTFNPATPSEDTYDYYVSASAVGGGDGSNGDEFTLSEAIARAVAGDTIMVEVGVYNVTTTAINFDKNGIVANPIVWVGVIADDSSYSGENNFGITSTLIYGSSTSNTRITMSGDYNEFHNTIFKQGQARQLIEYSGDHVTFDSCAFKYPPNVSSSSNHLVRASGDPDNTTFRYCHFYHSPRTAIWHGYHTSTTNAPDSLTIENCYFTGHTSHPAFQIMPNTGNLKNSSMRMARSQGHSFRYCIGRRRYSAICRRRFSTSWPANCAFRLAKCTALSLFTTSSGLNRLATIS